MKRLFLPVGFLLAVSVVMLSSISLHLFYLQLVWIAAGALLIFIFNRIDIRSFLNYRWLIWGLYTLAVLLVFLAYVAGPVIRNTRSWIVIGPFQFQPVELVKVALILAYAQYFSRRHLAIARWKNIFASFAIFILPAGIVALQPDLGSAVILFGIWFGFLLVSGLPRRRIIAAFFIFIIAGFIGWHTVLKDYQRLRIQGVFYPERNVLTINYSVIQSKIAIGSAGLWGKGYKQGTQTQLGFLSEPANDFIFAATVEEWGIAGGAAVVAAFLFLLAGILKVGLAAQHNFEKFICLGTAIVFLVHFIVNAGSAVGLFPVVGVTFPFLSYGGSSLLTNFFLLAIIYSIARRA